MMRPEMGRGCFITGRRTGLLSANFLVLKSDSTLEVAQLVPKHGVLVAEAQCDLLYLLLSLPDLIDLRIKLRLVSVKTHGHVYRVSIHRPFSLVKATAYRSIHRKMETSATIEMRGRRYCCR